jgi:cyclophilin family peptidyl-prolyl cis-trans isomerase
MIKKALSIIGLVLSLGTTLHAQEYKIIMNTSKGPIEMILYDKTPLHTQNFVKLAKEGFYDSLLFHRVIPEFMIQGGDPTSKNAPNGAMLGSGSHGERIPAEFNSEYIHKKGALAAARDNNPEKASSGCQFYIVIGKTYNDNELDMLAQRAGLNYTEEQRNIYKTIGGTPFLDQNYTVYGEVVKGIEAAESIVNEKRNGADRPDDNQYILTTEVYKLDKKGKYILEHPKATNQNSKKNKK